MKNIVDILVDNKITVSKGEARKLIFGGAVKVNGTIIDNIDRSFDSKDLKIQIGKNKNV